MMADNHQFGDVGDDDIFVYTGGRAPRHVRRARIDESIDTILEAAFRECRELIEVEGHNKLKKIEEYAFYYCLSLRRVSNMGGVKEIEPWAFFGCRALSDVDFDKLEIIRAHGFANCKSLRSINLPSVRRIGKNTFWWCTALTEAVFGKDLGSIEWNAFYECPSLRRIAIHLSPNLIVEDRAIDCRDLSRVDTVVGEIHKIISSLHMESWRNEMKAEIESINQTLPEIPPSEKTVTIQQWIRSVLNRMEHYKVEHQILLKEVMTLFELALWKSKLEENSGSNIEAETVGRKEHRVTCGASIVIKNVLPFLALE